jgi:ankyrin repeat protein
MMILRPVLAVLLCFLVILSLLNSSSASSSKKRSTRSNNRKKVDTEGRGDHDSLPKKRNKDKGTAHTSSQVQLSNGVQLQFNDKKALPTLSSWAKEISTHGYTVSHGTAMARESQVVELVNSGKWTVEAYHDYQRLAAGTGNVDSARLLFEYSIGPDVYGGIVVPPLDVFEVGDDSIDRTKSRAEFVPGLIKSLHKSLLRCNTRKFMKLLDDDRIGAEKIPLLRLSAFASTMPTATSGSPQGSTTLLMASSYLGCADIVAKLLDHLLEDPEFDVDEVGSHGVTALMAAAAGADIKRDNSHERDSKDDSVCGHCEVIRILVQNGGANINYKHKFASTTALHMAAEQGSHRTIPTLCQLGANTSAATSTGTTPLHTAAQVGSNEQTVRALVIDCGIPVDLLMNGDTTALYMASQHGHVHTVKALLALNASVNFAMPTTAYRGDTSVQRASSSENDYSSWRLNTEAGNGATALHTAAEEGHPLVVRTLVQDGGADIDSVAIGVTALHLAVQYRRMDVVKELIALGASLDQPSRIDGTTALYYAAGAGMDEFVKELANAGCYLLARYLRVCMRITNVCISRRIVVAAINCSWRVSTASRRHARTSIHRPTNPSARTANCVGRRHTGQFECLASSRCCRSCIHC